MLAWTTITPADVADRVVASDPGWHRLRRALRTTLTAVAVTFVLSRLADPLGYPDRVTVIGVVVSMFSSALVRDPDIRRQRITLPLMGMVAIAIVTVGTLAMTRPTIGVAVFFVAIFAAVFVRRYGPRASALGRMLFFAYFYSVFFDIGAAHLPWMAFAVAVGIVVAWLMRFVAIRDEPEPIAAHMRRALRARARMCLRRIVATLARTPRRSRSHRALRSHLQNLTATALAIDQQAGGGCDDRAWSEALFDLELGIESLADIAASCRARLDDDGRRQLVRLVQALIAVLRRPDDADARNAATRVTALAAERLREAGVGDPTPWRLQRATQLVVRAAHARPTSSVRDEGTSHHGSGDRPRPAEHRWLDDATRKAVQATLAAVAAWAAGTALSPSRWYWAVIGAFVVFSQTTTVGESVTRAVQRAIGTGAGVVAGLLIAHAVIGHRSTELALIYLFMFVMFYFRGASVAGSSMALTTVLAILFALLGMYRPELLLLRLEETLVGAGLGAVIATLVLPTPTSNKVCDAMRGMLVHSGELLERAAAEAERSGATPVAATRGLDRSLQGLHGAVRPLRGMLRAGSSRMLAHYDLVALLGYCVRHLATALARLAPTEVSPELRQATEALAQTCARLAAAVGGDHDAVRPPPLPTDRLKGRVRGDQRATMTFDWLDRTRRVATDLADRLRSKQAVET